MQILTPDRAVRVNNNRPLTQAEEIAHNGSGIILAPPIFDLIFGYWNRTHSPTYMRPAELTYDLIDAAVNIFPSRAVQATEFEHKTRLFSTFDKHHGSSSISFRDPSNGRKDTGFIRSIWTVALQGEIHTFVMVQPHTVVSAEDLGKTPYSSHPGFKCMVAYSQPRQPRNIVVVEPRHIISHLAYNPRPKGTFGIKQEITIFVDSLHRNRD